MAPKRHLGSKFQAQKYNHAFVCSRATHKTKYGPKRTCTLVTPERLGAYKAGLKKAKRGTKTIAGVKRGLLVNSGYGRRRWAQCGPFTGKNSRFPGQVASCQLLMLPRKDFKRRSAMGAAASERLANNPEKYAAFMAKRFKKRNAPGSPPRTPPRGGAAGASFDMNTIMRGAAAQRYVPNYGTPRSIINSLLAAL